MARSESSGSKGKKGGRRSSPRARASALIEPGDRVARPVLEQLWMLRTVVALGEVNELDHQYQHTQFLREVGLPGLIEKHGRAGTRDRLRRVLSRIRSLERAVEPPPPTRARGTGRARSGPGSDGPDARALGDPGTHGTLFDSAARLARLLNLQPVERDLLALAVLVKDSYLLDELIQDAAKRSTPALKRAIATILGYAEEEVNHALAPGGALATTQLLKVCLSIGRFSEGPLEVLEGLPTLLRERHPTDEALLGYLVELAPPATLSLADFEHLQPTLDLLLRYLGSALEGRRLGANVFLHGPPGVGKTELSRSIAEALGAELFSVPVTDAVGDPVGPGHRMQSYLLCQRVVTQRQRPSLLLFDEVGDVIGDPVRSLFDPSFSDWANHHTEGWLNRVLEKNPVPTLWVGNHRDRAAPAMLRRFDLVVEVPVPPLTVRAGMIRGAARGLRLGERTVSALAEIEEVSPADIDSAVRVVRWCGTSPGKAAERGVKRLLGMRLETRGRLEPRLRALPSRSREERDCQGGAPASLEYDPGFVNPSVDLARLVAGLRSSRKGRLCFEGPPGTGKTATASHIAKALELPVVSRRASEILSKWIGDTEKALADAFHQAAKQNAILVLDEIDAFLQDRERALVSWEVTQVSELLVQLEAFPGIFIGCTNLLGSLDRAAIRRFDLKVRFDPLEPDQCWSLFQAALRALVQGRGKRRRGAAPSPDGRLRRRLDALTLLTPGDFALALRQAPLVGLCEGHPDSTPTTPTPTLHAEALIEMLEREHALKPAQPRRVGFDAR